VTCPGRTPQAGELDTQYDTLSQQYITAVDLSAQRTIAGQIQTLLLDQTPSSTGISSTI
jgi:peptide/nickel transport system substrate-binding protein